MMYKTLLEAIYYKSKFCIIITNFNGQ